MTYEALKERLMEIDKRSHEGTADENERYIYNEMYGISAVTFCEIALALGLVE